MMQIMSSISVENWTMWTSVYSLATSEFQVAYRRKYNDVLKLVELSLSRGIEYGFPSRCHPP